MATNLKKRARTDFTLQPTAPVKRAKVAVVGAAFSQGIENIDSSSSPDVHTHVSLPMTYGPSKPWALDLHATFSGKDHNSTTDNTKWTQGWMDMGGETSYAKVLPEPLTLERATVETRVMKALAQGGTYQPKTTHFGSVTRKDKMTAETKNWGRIALQSHVEDITARNGLGLEDVGSGMRAMVLTAKLKMKTKGTQSKAGFADKMLDQFPQLRTAESTPVGGAAHYNALIHQELALGNSATHTSLATKTRNAHDQVNQAISDRFDHKWAKIRANQMTTKQAGKWWTAKIGANKQGPNTFAGKSKATLRTSYTENKLQKHGITHAE